MRLLDAFGVSLLRLYERAKTFERWSRKRNLKYGRDPRPDGLPLPPAHLLARVAGNSDIFSFLDGGERAANTVRELLDLQACASLLDFGCGCGRVLRFWKNLERTEIHGTDYDAELVRWCSENLPFARVAKNALDPPTLYSDGSFDAIYAFSVFTHLPAAKQHAWMREFARLLSSGGHLILSTHGEHYLNRLTADERKRFQSGELVERHAGAGGTNWCNTYHPETWVGKELARDWEVIRHVPRGAKGNPMQDVWLLRRPAPRA